MLKQLKEKRKGEGADSKKEKKKDKEEEPRMSKSAGLTEKSGLLG